MIKVLPYAFLFSGLLSCTHRAFETRAKTVTFTADDAVFTDSSATILTYNAIPFLEGGPSDWVKLRKGQNTYAIIYGPTIFRNEDGEVLVYPGERIRIRREDDSNSFYSADGDSTRDRELQLLKRFQELEKSPAVPADGHCGIDAITRLEQVQTQKIKTAEAASRKFLDSLEKLYRVSEKFRQLTSSYIDGRYNSSLVWLYKANKDTLLARGLYHQKFQALIPSINAIHQRADFNSNMRFYLHNTWFQLFPGETLLTFNEQGFQAAFDTAKSIFRGPARDNLLSRIMYVAYSRGVSVPHAYAKAYRRYCMDKAYRRIVHSAKKERLQPEKKTVANETSKVKG